MSRTHRKTIRLNNEELELFDNKKAELKTKNDSEAIRKMIQKSKITVKDESIKLEQLALAKELNRNLKYIGVNLNQTQKQMNIDSLKNEDLETKFDNFNNRFEAFENDLDGIKTFIMELLK